MGVSFCLSTWQDTYDDDDFSQLRQRLENWVFTAHPLPSWEELLTCQGVASAATPWWLAESMVHFDPGSEPDWDALREGRITVPVLEPLSFRGWGNLPYTLVDDSVWQAFTDVFANCKLDNWEAIDIVPLEPHPESHEIASSWLDEGNSHRDIFAASWVLWNFGALPVTSRLAADELMRHPDFPNVRSQGVSLSNGFRATIGFLAYQSLRTRQPVRYRG